MASFDKNRAPSVAGGFPPGGRLRSRRSPRDTLSHVDKWTPPRVGSPRPGPGRTWDSGWGTPGAGPGNSRRRKVKQVQALETNYYKIRSARIRLATPKTRTGATRGGAGSRRIASRPTGVSLAPCLPCGLIGSSGYSAPPGPSGRPAPRPEPSRSKMSTPTPITRAHAGRLFGHVENDMAYSWRAVAHAARPGLLAVGGAR